MLLFVAPLIKFNRNRPAGGQVPQSAGFSFEFNYKWYEKQGFLGAPENLAFVSLVIKFGRKTGALGDLPHSGPVSVEFD